MTLQGAGVTPAQRALAAEVRAVEEGHHAVVQPGGWLRIVSDSRPGKSYAVSFAALSTWGPVAFSCEPRGEGAYSDDHLSLTGQPGIPPCKHSALAARRLEREGLAHFDGTRWVATPKAGFTTEPGPEVGAALLRRLA